GVLDAPETRELLDFSQPIAVMMVALLHFVPESAKPREVVRRYHERLAPGSYLALSHITGDDDEERVGKLVELYQGSSDPLTLRSRDEVAELVSDFELVEPGVVYLSEWRPESPEDRWERPEQSIGYGALGR